MHMQQLQVVVFHHVHQHAGKRRFVWRIVKKRVGGYLHFVIKNIRNKAVQTNRLLVSDEVNVVSFLR